MYGRQTYHAHRVYSIFHFLERVLLQDTKKGVCIYANTTISYNRAEIAQLSFNEKLGQQKKKNTEQHKN